MVGYGTGIIDWTKYELEEKDRKTRKQMTIYRVLLPQADVDRLYIRRSESGVGVEECVVIENNSLLRYIERSEEKSLMAVHQEQTLKEKCWDGQSGIPRRNKQKKKSWEPSTCTLR